MICSPASPARCSTCGCSSSHSSTSGSGKCTANCLTPAASNFRLDFFALLWYLMAIAALLFQRKVLIPDSIRVRAESRYFLFQVSTTGGTISALFDPDLVDQLVGRTRELGIDVYLETEAIAIGRSAGQLFVRALASGETRTFQTEMVVHAAGRVPEINGLNLDGAGIKWDKRGVLVNEFLQSVSNPTVYAAGDAASGGLPLAPVASYEGQIVAANLI